MVCNFFFPFFLEVREGKMGPHPWFSLQTNFVRASFSPFGKYGHHHLSKICSELEVVRPKRWKLLWNEKRVFEAMWPRKLPWSEKHVVVKKKLWFLVSIHMWWGNRVNWIPTFPSKWGTKTQGPNLLEVEENYFEDYQCTIEGMTNAIFISHAQLFLGGINSYGWQAR